MKFDFEIVWHGGKVDALGTKGGLLGQYGSRSTWHHTETVLFRKLGQPPGEPVEKPSEDPEALPELVLP